MPETTLTPMIIAKVIKATILTSPAPNLAEKERTIDITFFTGTSKRYNRIFTLKSIRFEKDEYATDTRGNFIIRETVFIRRQQGRPVSFGFAQSKLPVDLRNKSDLEQQRQEYFVQKTPGLLILPKNFLDLLEPEKEE